MSRIDDLIRDLCPQGVDFRAIGEIAEVGTGNSDRKDSTSDGQYPFYVRSQTVLQTDRFEFDEEAIVIPGEGGIGEIFHFVSGKYGLHQRAYRISFRIPQVDAKFAFYYFSVHFKKLILTKALSATVTSIRKPMITEFRIPLPPLEVQREIVRILDDFTWLKAALEAELEAELEARRRQYEFYRHSLLMFGAEIPRATLGDLASVRTGQAPGAGTLIEGGRFSFVNAGNSESGRCLEFNTTGDTVTIPSRGQGGVGVVGYQVEDFWCGPLCYRIKSESSALLTRFLFHYLKSVQSAIRALQQEGGTPALNRKELVTVEVPVPAIDDQIRVVGILDRFDDLIKDLSTGLPAELAARRKQYEYYREKLLTFEEAPA